MAGTWTKLDSAGCDTRLPGIRITGPLFNLAVGLVTMTLLLRLYDLLRLRLRQRCAVEVIQYVMAYHLLVSSRYAPAMAFQQTEWATLLGPCLRRLNRSRPFPCRSSSTAMQHSYKLTTICLHYSASVNARNRGFRISLFPHWLLFSKNCTVSAAGVTTRRSR